MVEVDTSGFIDAITEIISVIITVFLLIVDTMIGELWDFIVRTLSINHLGQTPAVVLITLGFLFCLWVYVMRFW